MSYILDALRRADSERERGSVPSIHAQPVPLGSADGEPRHRTSRTLVWVSAGLAALLVASLAWQMLGRDAPPEPAALSPMVVTPTVTTPTPPIAAPAPPPVAELQPIESMPAPAPASTAPVRTQPVAPVRKPAQAVAASSRPTAARPTAQAAVPASATSAEGRVLSASELPDEVQRGLPTFVVGGASYSQNPVNRMLIVNGQVFREGDKLAPDVSLEQIRLKEAVLVTKGYRYRIVY